MATWDGACSETSDHFCTVSGRRHLRSPGIEFTAGEESADDVDVGCLREFEREPPHYLSHDPDGAVPLRSETRQGPAEVVAAAGSGVDDVRR